MNAPRAHAYARVTMTLRDLGPAKLQPSEQTIIRHAADSLLFCADIASDASAQAAFAALLTLHEHLIDSGRWSSRLAGRLADDVWACGPASDGMLAQAAA
jgi:hypothetical protein